MTRLASRLATYSARSWRDDPDVPAFDDTVPLIVYDGVCVFCSHSMAFVARHDRAGAIRYTAAQSTLGQALFRHFDLAPQDFETVLVLDAGRAHSKRDAMRAIARHLAWPWRAMAVLTFLPRAIADRAYDAVASRRYRLFGRTEACQVPDAAWRSRVIE